MKKLVSTLLIAAALSAPLAGCDQKNDNNNNDTNENKASSHIITSSQTSNSDFDSYESIINSFCKLSYICENYDEKKDVEGEYEKMFKFGNDTEREWYTAIFQSVLIYRPFNISYGYSVGDINNDGTDELLLMLADSELIAIFTKQNGKPVLLDRFWTRKRGFVDTQGQLHVFGNGGAAYFTQSVYKISDGKLNLIAEIGADGISEDNETIYYKLDSGKKATISRAEFEGMAESEPFKNEFTLNTFDNKGVKFISCDNFENINDKETVNFAIWAIFEQVYAGERVVLKDGEQINLGDCTGYSGKPIDCLENQVAHMDFDGDGYIEALVQSGADGEHILHYDFTHNTVYATFISPRGGYVYFANGELAHNYEDDNIRQKIVKFDNEKIELEEVNYTGAVPNREKPEWSYVVIKTPDKG